MKIYRLQKSDLEKRDFLFFPLLMKKKAAAGGLYIPSPIDDISIDEHF